MRRVLSPVPIAVIGVLVALLVVRGRDLAASEAVPADVEAALEPA